MEHATMTTAMPMAANLWLGNRMKPLLAPHLAVGVALAFGLAVCTWMSETAREPRGT